MSGTLRARDLMEGRRAKEDELVTDIPAYVEKKARVAIPSIPVLRAFRFQGSVPASLRKRRHRGGGALP